MERLLVLLFQVISITCTTLAVVDLRSTLYSLPMLRLPTACCIYVTSKIAFLGSLQKSQKFIEKGIALVRCFLLQLEDVNNCVNESAGFNPEKLVEVLKIILK